MCYLCSNKTVLTKPDEEVPIKKSHEENPEGKISGLAVAGGQGWHCSICVSSGTILVSKL